MITFSVPQGLKITAQGEINTHSLRNWLSDQINKINKALESINTSSQVGAADIQPIVDATVAIRDICKFITDVATKFIKKDTILSVELTSRDLTKHIEELKNLLQWDNIDLVLLQSACQKLESSAKHLESFAESNMEILPIYYSSAIAETMQQKFLDLSDGKMRKTLNADGWKAYFSEKGPSLFHVYGDLHNGSIGEYWFNQYGRVTIPKYPHSGKTKWNQLFYYIGLCKFLSIIKENKKFTESVFRTTPERTISIENAIDGFCDLDSVKQYGTQTSNLDISMIYGVFEANFKAFLDIVLEKRSAFKK